jgi:hypothetical protein
MGSILLSMIIPLNSFRISLGISIQKDAAKTALSYNQAADHGNNLHAEKEKRLLQTGGENVLPVQKKAIDLWITLAVKIYLIVAAALLIRILGQLIFLFHQYARSEKTKQGNYVMLKNHRFRNTFSFFRWIFVAREPSSHEEMEQIIAHEKIHADQFHTIDLILVELLTSLMWFNPLIWKMKNTVQLVHEYLADEGVLSTGIDVFHYQTLLVNQIAEERLVSLSSSFNHLLIKKRINMMSKNKMNKNTRLKGMALLPLTFALLFVMSCINGLFSENLQAGAREPANSLKVTENPGQSNPHQPVAKPDTIKKTIITKVVRKDNPRDTLIEKTETIIISDDTASAHELIWNIKTDSAGKRKDVYYFIGTELPNDDEVIVSDSIHKIILRKQDKDENIIEIRRSTGVSAEKELSKTLVIIDGVKHLEKNALAGLDPDQIVSIDVIKDKNKMKKYTSKDFQGVIVVVTKKGNK